jgi:LacI family transcriptional regulator
MASILDVAREANVAVSTVSLVLNHRDRVSPETRQRVDVAINQLGYRPRARQGTATRPARKGRSTLRVGFIYTLESMHDASVSIYCREIVAGIQDALGETDSTLSIIRGAQHVDNDVMLKQQLDARELDGLILFGPEPSNGYLEYLSEANIPMVVFNRLNPQGKFSCVTLDYYGAGRLCIKHLAGLGHTKIGVLYGSKNTGAYYRKLAYEGITDEFKAQGLTPLYEESYEGINHPEQVDKIIETALATGITALCAGDRVITHATPALERAGIIAPTNFSLIGMDNLNLSYRGKRLTSIGYDRLKMGRKSVKMLQRLIQHPDEVRWMASSVPCFVVEGETTGKPVTRA